MVLMVGTSMNMAKASITITNTTTITTTTIKNNRKGEIITFVNAVMNGHQVKPSMKNRAM
jgi:hypothetical protein